MFISKKFVGNLILFAFKQLVGLNRGNVGQPFVPPSQNFMAYHGPPPPPPSLPHLSHLSHLRQHPPAPQYTKKHHPNEIPEEKQLAVASSTNELWSSPATDAPKIISLDVKCEKKGMKVFLQFDKPFYGIVFSKGHYSNINCVYLPAGLGRTSATFDIGKTKRRYFSYFLNIFSHLYEFYFFLFRHSRMRYFWQY